MANNQGLYDAIIAGSVGGALTRWITATGTTAYDGVVDSCEAFAAAVDAAIPAIAAPGPSLSQINLLQSLVQGVCSNRNLVSQDANVFADIGAAIGSAFNEASLVLFNEPDIVDDAVTQPFRNTVYVNPASTASPTGSPSNPLLSIALAIALVTVANPKIEIILPPGVTIVEDIVIPDIVGADVAITGGVSGFGARTSITGTVTQTTVNQTVMRLTNLAVSSTLTGVATSAGGNFCYLTNTQIAGACNLTGTGSGFWWAIFDGRVTTMFQFGGGSSGVCNVTGSVFAEKYLFTGRLTGATLLDGCQLPAIVDIAPTQCTMRNCITQSMTVNAVSGTPTLLVDGETERSMIQSGHSLGAGLVMKSLMANASVQRTVNANLGSSSFTGASGLVANALYEASFVMELTAAGTAGTAVPEIRYLGIDGVARIEAIGPGLLVTAAVGTIARGTLLFMTNALGTPTYSVSGITTPGAFAANMRIEYRSPKGLILGLGRKVKHDR